MIDVKLAQKWTDVVLEIALVQMGARGLFVLPRVVFQIAGAEIIDSCALPPRLADGGEVFACPDLAPEDLRLCACGVGRPGRAVLANREPARPAADPRSLRGRVVGAIVLLDREQHQTTNGLKPESGLVTPGVLLFVSLAGCAPALLDCLRAN